MIFYFNDPLKNITVWKESDINNVAKGIKNEVCDRYIEITAWLASAYDFYAAIFHNKCIIKIVQTSQPCSNLFMRNI